MMFSDGYVIFQATFLVIVLNMAGCRLIQDDRRTCTPAEAIPSLNSSSCHRLINFSKPYCQNRGVTLGKYIFRTPKEQRQMNDKANKHLDDSSINTYMHFIRLLGAGILDKQKCKNALSLLACRQVYPSCDGTRAVFREQKVCRETCVDLISKCGKDAYEIVKLFYPESMEYINCDKQPERNAGDSPECWYYDAHQKKSNGQDCLYLDGENYDGDISVTASGIRCQMWTEQCPHRHTMTKTYPELNQAKNYCRNPQGSGQRPWCFTTDKEKRWEYCDIPKCIPEK